MKTQYIYIKNMVCDRCIKVVREELEQLGYPIKEIELGKVQLSKEVEVDIDKIASALEKEGFELIDDQSSKTISTIKTKIIELIHQKKQADKNQNLSTYLEKELKKSYSSLSSLFSEVEGRTIEKYAIQQRIERVKELLVYGEKTISEIAWELGYSSAQYLSNQFKSETGLSPSQFRNMMRNSRKSLDEV
ncbi:MAG: helix-turn-helix domain-containing protein [Balneolaceae bacterium]|nr:helix-turn-helix domain-containing protein [Balneolaceae bacterium]MBO6546295.1 helix-turn-helix domain-containing protein [Balneolaceae bacterium]MBO6648654.1 helix-turn-helix domain-containing protein [Balneolaceae bacterium]